MRKIIAPDTLGLHRTVIVEQIGSQAYSLVIRRKSRIIMADGRKLLEKSNKIKESLPGATVIVETSAPVCSKTRAFLSDHGIEVRLLTD